MSVDAAVAPPALQQPLPQPDPAAMPTTGAVQRQTLLGNAATVRAGSAPTTAAVPMGLGNAATIRAAAGEPAPTGSWGGFGGGGGAGGGFGGGGFGGGGAGGSWGTDSNVGARAAGATRTPSSSGSAGAAPGSPASPASAQSGRKRIDFKDIQLFERREWERSLFNRTGTSPIWSEKIPLGDYGYIAVDFTARWAANTKALAGLGPGMLRRIWVDLDPNAERNEGHAELFIPADIGVQALLGGSIEGRTSYLDVLPLLTIDGGLAGAGTASIPGAFMMPVTIMYERDILDFVVNPKVGVGLLLAFNLDAWASAAILHRELFRKLWHVVDWRWGRALQLGVRVRIEYKDGKLSPIEAEFDPPQPLPIEDILPEALSASAQASSLAQAAQTLMPRSSFAVLAFPIPSKWKGPEGPEPDCTPAGMTVDKIKPIAVPKKPPALQKGEYSGNTRYKNVSHPRLPDDTPSGQPITYLEYDRDPYDGVARNARRFIIGSDGTHFATNDHYASFWRFR